MGLRITRLAATTVFLVSLATACVRARTTDAEQIPAAPVTGGPKLVVILTVDQMRADYVDRFKDDWNRGLKRLVEQGAWFREAAFPYLATVTCVGHATIATGSFPRTHGIIQNAWWDRDLHQLTTCTQDPSARNIGYDAPVTGGDSAFRLATPTFADVMRTERGAHVVSLALKARSAIMTAGRGGDAVTWLTEAGDSWVTSTAFADAPVNAVKAFTDANPIAGDFGKTWTRMLPASRYGGPDDGEGEAPPPGWTRTFPHELKGKADTPDELYRTLWQRSPYADAYLGRFASALVESMRLGRHETTDVLSVSFSTPDLVGHAFGPQSHEVQDVFAHLDETIGTLLDRLDALVGKDRYVVALSSDHGVMAIPEQMKRAGQDAGRLDSNAIRTVIERHAADALGAGPYVARANGNDIYFEPGMYATITATPGAIERVIDAVAALPGIAKVYRSEQVRDGAQSSDPLLRAAALSYFPGRNGDLVIVPKPGWSFSATGTTHGTAAADNQRVPIVLMGDGIRPGEYVQPATPADIAPTLAALCGVKLPKTEGQPLTAALKATAGRPVGAPSPK